jgi:predicted permease
MRDWFSSWSRALRALRRTPGLAIGITLTLGLGIGLASSTGVVARGIAFAGLPVRDAERVVVLWGEDGAGSFTHLPLGPADLPALAERMDGVATIAAGDYHGAQPWPFHPAREGEAPLRLRGSLAGGNFFDLLGARPVLGRALRPEDDVIGAPRVVVLSHAAWRRNFGGDSAVLGRALRSVIFGETYTVVGVMPPGLDVPRGVDFWTALSPTAARNGSLKDSPHAVDVVARLAPGASPAQARDRLTAFYATLASQGRQSYAGARASVRTLPELVVGDVRPVFATFAAAAALVLLVTCANAGGLLLLRAGARRREMAVQMAIGAPRRRLMGDLAVQHALLAVGGAVLGALGAAAVVRLFVAYAPAELPRLADLGVDWSLLFIASVVTTVVLLAVGFWPAFAATRVAPASALGGAHEGAGGRASHARSRRWLVGGQVAVALVVLASATLVTRSLTTLLRIDLGVLEPERLTFVELVPGTESSAPWAAGGDPAARQARFLNVQEDLLSRLAQAPGIASVAPVVHEAFSGPAGWDARVEAVGAAPEDSAKRPYLNMEITNRDYLRVTGLTLRSGRWLEDADRESAPPVIVLSERAATMLFPGRDAVGERVKLWGDATATVVGVVGEARFRDFLVPRPTLYVPYRQFPGAALFLAVRSDGPSRQVADVVRRTVRDVSPALFVHDHGTMRDRSSVPLARPRLVAGVMLAFGAVVVALAVAGLYAVVAGSVSARRREFGVRSALGATPLALRTLVLGEGMRLAVAGVVAGLAVVLGGGGVLASVLRGVAPSDPLALGAAALGLLCVCVLAVLVPAVRAARADPARETRAE